MHTILIDFISLDGVVQSPGGPEEDAQEFAHGGWSHPYFDPETFGPVLGDVMSRSDALLYGRKTYENMAAAWPDRAGDPFADQMNALPKHVASRTLRQEDLTWNGSQLLDPTDAVGAVRALREQDGGGLQLWGSADFATQLMAADLIDELVLIVEPIVLGGGKSIFPRDGQARPMELVSTTVAGTGAVICSYRRVR